MQGNVTFDREATLSVTLRDAQGAEREVSCVVDTGFTSYLTLPQSLAALFGLVATGTVQVELADASLVQMGYCDGEVLWHDNKRTIDVIAAAGKPLLGMNLLYGSRVEMNVVDGGTLAVSPFA